MTPNYEYHGTYDPEAIGQIPLEVMIRDWLWTAELMLDFITKKRPEILDTFLSIVERKYSLEVKGITLSLDDVDFEKLQGDSSLLGLYQNIKDLCLRIVLKYLSLEKGYHLSGEKEPHKHLYVLQAKHMLLYHRINALVEILGREDGIQFYKDFVQYWGEALAKKGLRTDTYAQARKMAVRFWKDSDMFEFGVTDIDEYQFLAKFDRCALYESMKQVDDQELAYYTVCYPGPRLMKLHEQNVRMRRSVTLFSNAFCDELYWDRTIHDEPEQPSQEFSSRIVRK